MLAPGDAASPGEDKGLGRLWRSGLALAAASLLAFGPAAAPVAAADVATDDVYTAYEDQALSVPAPGVLANDTNDGGPPLCVLSYLEGTGFDIEADGSFLFTPAPNAPGAYNTSYELGSVGDGGACTGPAADTAQVVVNVENTNDPPVISHGVNCDDGITVAEDSGPLSRSDCVNVSSFGDNDIGQSLTAWIVSTANPSLFSAGPSITLDDPWLMQLTPAPNSHGATTISVQAKDTGGTANGGDDTSDVLVINVTITPVNDPPTANADTFFVLKDRTLNVNGPGLLANDSDIDGDDLTAIKASNPTHGVVTVAADGGFSYTPANDYVGPDAFSYRASDGAADSPARVVSLTVTSLPPSPTPVPPPTLTPTPTVFPAPTTAETLPTETLAPESLDPGVSVPATSAPASGATLTPGATTPPEPTGEEGGGISLPVLLTLVLLGVLLAFGAAVYVPKWLEAQRGGQPPPYDGP